ncbi:hypothetical protein [Microvirga puerhi]|uniref:Tyr recombinase domain-containing protein n=1 Tax=Microvirga puerhi TaxID=2876078 RepID=A0ABS7VTM1_9HYPH|nr:hypothetical protein [Microvirga puerhi]MBZ6078921.1 hypothetical protein [Microvirga puerhi]
MAHLYRKPSDWTDGRLPETANQYRRAASRFEKLAWRDKDGRLRWPGYIAGVHRYMQPRRGQLSRSSFRWYRNAAAFRAVELFGSDRLDLVHAEFSIYAPEAKKRTRYRKAVPTHVMRAIRKVVEADGRRSWKELFDVLVVMRTTGARPGELTGMLFNNLSGLLELPNSKYRPTLDLPGVNRDLRQLARTFPRGNGPARLLQVQPGWRDDPEYVKTAFRVIKRFKGRSWDDFQANASRTLKEILRRCARQKLVTGWWKRLRVYDFRHQFCADAKEALGFLDGEVAAAMGHVSGTTALYHYGRRASASKGGVAVRPVEGNPSAPCPPGRTPLGVATESLKKLARLVAKSGSVFARAVSVDSSTGDPEAGASSAESARRSIEQFWRENEVNNPPDRQQAPPPKKTNQGPSTK